VERPDDDGLNTIRTVWPHPGDSRGRFLTRRDFLLGSSSVVLFALATGACQRLPGTGGDGGDSTSTGTPETGTPSPGTPDTDTVNPPEPEFPALTPAQMAGQRVIYSYQGLTPPGDLLALIRHGQAAGVIFFSQNVSSPAQLASVVRTLEAANASADNPVQAPLLLMTDQEGGRVRRLPGEPTLSARAIGESADALKAATMAGAAAADNLKSVGLNVNLAPVLDVYRQPADFADRLERSFSTDPAAVSELGAAFITAQQSGGVAATAKHFPGLGAAATTQNTDEQPVTLRVPADVLRAVDAYPYAAAIDAGVQLIMTSWAVYPALDPNYPAGLSSIIVEGLLRDEFGFRGVTITDALEAKALAAFGGIGERATRAAAAGMDLILCSGKDYFEGVKAKNGLEAAYADGTLDTVMFEAAAQRVIELRRGLTGA